MVVWAAAVFYNGATIGGIPMHQTNDRSARFLAGNILFWITLAVHTGALLLSIRVSFFPGAEVLRTIVTTCAQIIAGLYGITAASFTFFLSRLDNLCAQDPTLDCIAASLKNRYKYLMWFLTGNVVVTLLASIILLYLPAPTETDHAFFYRFFCNEFLVSLGYSILFILYYSVTVVNPKAIEKEARKLKRRISPSLLPSGDVVAFITAYDAIERRCSMLVDQTALARIADSKGRRFEFTVELLALEKSLPAPLLAEIRRLHTYYACTVSCSPMTVTREMTELARKILDVLNQMTP